MQFFSVVGSIKNPDIFDKADEKYHSRVPEHIENKIRDVMETDVRKRRRKVFVFTSNIDIRKETAKINLGVIVYKDCKLNEEIENYLKRIELDVEHIEFDEIPYSTLESQIVRAHTYYEKPMSHILAFLGLSTISNAYDAISICEDLIYCEDLNVENDLQLAKSFSFEKSLKDELERIYQGEKSNKSNKFFVPVHYIISAVNEDALNEISEILIKHLYKNGRLKTKRYSTIFLSAQTYMTSNLESIYSCQKNGAVIIDFDFNEDETIGKSAVIDLCETINKYRNQVLTILLLNKNNKNIYNTVLGSLEGISVVELQDEFLGFEDAKAYLTNMAKKEKMSKNQKLFKNLKEDEVYTTVELNNYFYQWFDKKVKQSIYPQYKDFKRIEAKEIEEKSKGNAYLELDSMIGLSQAKKIINKTIDYYKIGKLQRSFGIEQGSVSMHLMFTGNPGTAKTTVARLFARIMKENGILSSGHIVEVGRGDLVGKFVGWTAPLVQKKFKEAKGGVLFIDEAYSLVDGKDGLFGDEAINTIVQEMENNREDLIVIFAGYPNEMEKFLDKNPGLRSRIAFHIPFEDYNTQELCEIAKHISNSKGLELTNGALEKLSDVFDKAVLQNDFGNGRFVRNVIENAKLNQATRLAKTDFDELKKSDLITLCESDIEMPPMLKTFEPKQMAIGF